ncbi:MULTISPECIES: S41 family peptidase [Corallincola]|uniref:S41 family peptidase n=3 Tax=Corallincola TaxID=1775176 RepID=A0A368NLC7_9GAMM|nr:MULTISPECIES: S41 family peptidase [Corallincola]RCU50966.1 S41 family peptidase [Corallincola holothuriorum]TAA45921.1 S41 family peptidase [Corallincola spongiicola]TCI04029.1 S41 family peptidase [Corallincola luteus]
MQHLLSRSWTFFIGLATGMMLTLAGSGLASKPQDSPAFQDAARIYSILQQIREFYVDEVAYDALVDDAISAIVSHLDRHSDYLDRNEFAHLTDVTSGEYAGVGMELAITEQEVTIVNLFPGSPALEAGVVAGDRVISVDGQLLADSDAETLLMGMRGPAGSLMHLTVQREGEPELLNFALERRQIDVKSVSQRMLNDATAYLKINSFTQTTPQEVATALKELALAPQLSGLILDLRDNPGGLLDSALEVADLFLDEGVIVKTRGRYYEANVIYFANTGEKISGISIAVLINGRSASAAEIVAGALQGNRRATVFGEQSFGKGSIQSLFPVQPGEGVLKLTTAHYFTPDGLAIDGKGITPDRFVPSQVVLESLLTPIINPLPLNTVVAYQGEKKIQIANQDNQLRTALQALDHPD